MNLSTNTIFKCQALNFDKNFFLQLRGTTGGLLAGIVRVALIRTFEVDVRVWTVTMDGTHHNISAFHSLGIVRVALIRTFEVDVRVWTVTMDGTHHNISAFHSLGATLHPKDLSDLDTSFSHPHCDSQYEVSAIMDPPHMFKLLRNCLADYGQLIWPGKGIIKWIHIVKLHELQDTHGLRLGTKVTKRHIHFYRNKMKVSIAVQVIASNSVAKALRLVAITLLKR